MLHFLIIAFLHMVEGLFACRALPFFRRFFFLERSSWVRYLIPWIAALVYFGAAFLDHGVAPVPSNIAISTQRFLA